MNKTLFRISFIFCLFWYVQINHANASITYCSKNVQFADELMEKGAVNTACYILKKELKNPAFTVLQRHQILKLIADCYLKELDHVHYDEYNRKAYELVKHSNPIYKAEYFMERVYFFNFLTWNDSVLYYASEAKKIFDANYHDRHKINLPFFFRMYGLSYLYVNYPKEKLTAYGMPQSKAQMMAYFDSSFALAKRYPYRHASDLALAYRGYGNRHLDMISGYHIPTKQSPYKITKLGWYCFYKAIRSYYKANSLLNKANRIEAVNNYALLAMAYMCIGNPYKAERFFDTLHKNFFSVKHQSMTAPRTYLNALTYQRGNDFNLPYDPVKNQNAINRLIKILPNWVAFISNSGRYTYDTYFISPYNQLFSYYSRKYLHSHDTKDALRSISYLISEKNHFTLFKSHENADRKFKLLSAQHECSQLSNSERNRVFKICPELRKKILIQNTKPPFLNVESIMKQLNNGDAILMDYPKNTLFYSHKILVTNKLVRFIKVPKKSSSNALANWSTLTFEQYKKWAFNAYCQQLLPILKRQPNIRRIFLLHDDDTPYELMIQRNKGTTYSDLPYLLNKIQFTKVYDVRKFFQSKHKGTRKLDYLCLKTSSEQRLPFMQSFDPSTYFNARFNKLFTHANFSKNTHSKGILHVVGHGELSNTFTKYDNQFISYGKKDTVKFSNLNCTHQVQRDLTILSNCYSGVRVSYAIEFDRGVYLELMNKGANAVIANNDRVDDYVSRMIYTNFYTNLNQGIPVAEALTLAKRQFIQKNKNAYASPMYWGPFFAISSRRVKF